MTILTIATTTDGFSADDLDRAAGRADAYDDHATLTIDQLNVRSGYLADFHPNRAYAEGYSAYVKGAQLEEEVNSGRRDAVPTISTAVPAVTAGNGTTAASPQ